MPVKVSCRIRMNGNHCSLVVLGARSRRARWIVNMNPSKVEVQGEMGVE
jgi:hypothetical protein